MHTLHRMLLLREHARGEYSSGTYLNSSKLPRLPRQLLVVQSPLSAPISHGRQLAQGSGDRAIAPS